MKRETLKLIETFVDKADDAELIAKNFVPAMMDPILGDYARNVSDARESEVLSLFATIINKCVSQPWLCLWIFLLRGLLLLFVCLIFEPRYWRFLEANNPCLLS